MVMCWRNCYNLSCALLGGVERPQQVFLVEVKLHVDS